MSANGFARAGEDGRLTLAVPSKGRMSGPSLDLLEAAGLSFEVNERSLHVPCSNAPVELLFVRPQDIPEYVQDGVVDAGITGANLIAESQARSRDAARARLRPLRARGGGSGRRAAAVPRGSGRAARRDDLPVSTRAALAERGVTAELVLLSGSVEAAPRLGLADAIVDLVSTGSTMTANGCGASGGCSTRRRC